MKKWFVILSLVMFVSGCQTTNSENTVASDAKSSTEQNQPETERKTSDRGQSAETSDSISVDSSGTDTSDNQPSPSSGNRPEQTDEISNGEKQGNNIVANNSVLAERAQLHPVFAFANTKANRLLVPAEGAPKAEVLKLITHAIGQDGSAAEVKYAGEQKASSKNSGRMTAENFEQAGGFVFDLISGKLVANQTYFLFGSQAVPTSSVISFADRKTKTPAPEIRMRIEQDQERMITDLWTVAELKTGEQLVLTEFVQVYGQALATLSLVSKEKVVSLQFPAKVDENSTWRVDDGGKIHPEHFKLIFAARTKEGVVLGVTWGGAEGERQMLLLEHTDELKEQGESHFRYWSPM